MTTAEITQTVECYECERERPKDATYEYELYDTPWDDVGTTAYLCTDEFGHAEVERENGREVFESWEYYESCEEVLKDSGWSSFRYFDCVECDRTICEQDPKNGYHQQYRINDIEEYEQVCLQCFQDQILRYGISRDSVENGELSGLFFQRGKLDDWDKVIDYKRIDDSETKQEVLDDIYTWMDEDYKVAIDYERMGIGCLEGYISVYRKKI